MIVALDIVMRLYGRKQMEPSLIGLMHTVLVTVVE